MNKHLKHYIKDVDKSKHQLMQVMTQSNLVEKVILKSDKSGSTLVYVSTHVTIFSTNRNLYTFGGKWVK